MWKQKLNLTPTRRHSCLPAGQRRLPASFVSPPASPVFPEPDEQKNKNKIFKKSWVSILIFQAGLLVSQIQYQAMTVKRKKLRMTYVQLVNSGHTLASLRFSFSSFSWSWPPSAPLLVSMLCSCGLLCCSASGCFRPSSAATLDCFTSVMLKDKIHIRGRSQNKHVSWQIIHFCYFWIKAYAPKN